ncbi:hypothetical protein ACGFIJ_35820 [Microbispora bryophytorum]|uniref:hypothetical protein n=1 Tax=Microbispora bryophytorum TaxID=1460882 RepID=UPI003718EAFD
MSILVDNYNDFHFYGSIRGRSTLWVHGLWVHGLWVHGLWVYGRGFERADGLPVRGRRRAPAHVRRRRRLCRS